MVEDWGLVVRVMLICAVGFLALVGEGVGVDMGFGGLVSLSSMSMKSSKQRETG
jgi:hypothetical protein